MKKRILAVTSAVVFSLALVRTLAVWAQTSSRSRPAAITVYASPT
ncbi:MAG TPA: hypothetical protein VNN77_05970 [candidate division Zixibacteria bacterium]|nr:hypothetical protein [candidate division Zixibacteria bacterium]